MLVSFYLRRGILDERKLLIKKATRLTGVAIQALVVYTGRDTSLQSRDIAANHNKDILFLPGKCTPGLNG